MVLLRIVVYMVAAGYGNSVLQQLNIACGGTRLSYAPLQFFPKLATTFIQVVTDYAHTHGGENITCTTNKDFTGHVKLT